MLDQKRQNEAGHVAKLPLPFLRKLKRRFESYLAAMAKVESEVEKIDALKLADVREIERLKPILAKHCEAFDDLSRNKEKVWLELQKHQIGFMAGLMQEHLSFAPADMNRSLRGFPEMSFWRKPPIRLRKSSTVSSLINDYEQLTEAQSQRLAEGKEIDKQIRELEYKKYSYKAPKTPQSKISLTVNGAWMQVDLSLLSLEVFDDFILRHKADADEKNSELKELKARAASNAEQSRKLAAGERRKIARQLAILDVCPYCGSRLSADDAHLDHIYPVSKGGQSRPKNLIFVCAPCNLKKRDNTLRVFIKTFSLDEVAIHERLELLAKDF